MRTRTYAELRIEGPIDDARESARKRNRLRHGRRQRTRSRREDHELSPSPIGMRAVVVDGDRR